MNFEWDAEQLALRDAVRDLLEKHCSGEHVRKVTETPEGHDPALWRRMARELGLTGIALPEAEVTLADTPATPVGGIGAGLGVVRGALDTAAVLLACEQVGGAERVLAAATGYAGTRVQFERPIGSFQAIKHLLADVLLDVRSARAAVDHACWVADNEPEQLAWVAPMTKAFAADAYLLAARANVQVHGGIGFTWEHDAHLYLRRATSSAQLLGSPETHRERLAGYVFGNL